MPKTYQKLYIATLAFGGLLTLTGILYDFSGILSGLLTIITSQDMLITDYVEIAGLGAALVNAGIVTMLSVALLYFSKEPFNGMTIVTTMLMAGFSLFGKNFVNIWPIIFGTWLYAKFKNERFSKYVSVSLLATALAPLVSYMALGSTIASIPVGILAGVIVGFVIPPISGYTYKIQNGINLYNVGFACGLFALMIVPVLTAFGDNPPEAMYWNQSMNRQWIILLTSLCGIMLVWGLFLCGKSPKQVLSDYGKMMKKSGRSPSDFLRMFGLAPVLVNMAVIGMIGMFYILLIDGDLNGPTIGGIMTIIGFGAFGKHPKNMVPVMIGVLLGAYGMHLDPNSPTLQLAGLFGTTLAPITGQFGVIAGIAVGFIHASLVQQTSGAVAGMNLYNNGFSGGLIAIVMYPLLTEIVKKRKIKLRDKDYFEVFEENTPIDPAWHRNPNDVLDVMEEELKKLKKIKNGKQRLEKNNEKHKRYNDQNKKGSFMHYDELHPEDYTHGINETDKDD
ncbi:MAG: DUF1576 domain-containing protein [Bacillota bacterium]